jgi:hypothetical protein
MNPITSDYLAQLRMEDLHREAEQYRFGTRFRPAGRPVSRIRAVAGSWLITAGERLLSASSGANMTGAPSRG